MAEYFDKFVIDLAWYATSVKFDFSNQDDYIDYFLVKIVHSDELRINRSIRRNTSLKIHETSMEDHLINPFDQETDQFTTLQVKPGEYSEKEQLSTSTNTYRHIFRIDSEMQVQKRHRYTFWELLSDTGGFHDGLCLIIFLIMSPISSNKFQNDLIDKALRPAELTLAQKKEKQKFARALDQEEHNQRSQEQLNYYEHLRQAVDGMQMVRVRIWQQFLNILVHCFRRNRGHRSMQRLADFYTA